MKVPEKLSKGLAGIAGEYFVAGELSRRGYMASITLRNNDSIDIHASRSEGKRLLAIQVKSNQTGKRSWPLGSKAESLQSENMFYIFVSFKDISVRPEYFIVPSTMLAQRIKKAYLSWLKAPGKKGQMHTDNSIRKFNDLKGEFLERWDLLE